jgi:glutamate 5-kinase
MEFDLGKRKKIVIKIGSSLLVEEGVVRENWLKDLALDISNLIKKNIEVVIVTSGAIALGKNFLKSKNKKLSLEEKQAAAAIGQIQLMSFYRSFFKKNNLEVAQILLTAADCNNRERYLNSQNTISTLLKNHIIPIINENDTVAVDEIKIGDNDRLAARVAQMISADLLILFSDIDGLYDKNPKTNKEAKLIFEVKKITKDIEDMAGGSSSNVGTGGMITKIKAAKMLNNSSCNTIITSGLVKNPLQKLLAGKQNYTIFYSENKNSKSRKKWLSGILNAKGEIVINICAKEALISKKISLLPIGVLKINGNFEKGEAVFVKDEDGNHIASGITSYSSYEAERIIGKNSNELKEILGKTAKKELIHIDNLVMVKN